jgi:lipopolysaccharide export system permease protein
MRIVTKKGVEITVLFELFGHIAMSFLPMAVPLSLLFSMIYTLNKLSEDSEIVAIRAMGVNKRQLFAPFIIVGLICAVTIFSLNRNIIPYSKRLFKNTVITLTSKGFLADIKKEQFYTDIPGVTLFAEEVSPDSKIMTNVFIKLKKSRGQDKIMMAKKGVLIKDNVKTPGSLNLKLDLYDGNIISLNKEGKELEKILFDKYEFPIVSGSSNSYVNKDSMRSTDELIVEISKAKANLAKAKAAKNENDIKRYTSRYSKSTLEYWTRFNVPFQCIAFVLLGFVFGVKKGRGRAKNTSVLALLITILYYVLFFTGVSMAKKGTVPPYIVVFLPTFIVSLIGAYFYKKLDWAS